MRKPVWIALAAAIFLSLLRAPSTAAQQPQSEPETRSNATSAPKGTGGGTAVDEKKSDGRIEHSPAPPGRSGHRFWDRENDWLFAAVGAGRALDYASTLNLRGRGINEVFLTNSIVDNHALFAGIEAAGTAASIGLSYAFHRTGHHQLERWTSIVHFGVATGGAIRNYALPTPH